MFGGLNGGYIQRNLLRGFFLRQSFFVFIVLSRGCIWSALTRDDIVIAVTAVIIEKIGGIRGCRGVLQMEVFRAYRRS